MAFGFGDVIMDKIELKDTFSKYGKIFKKNIFKYSKQAKENINDWGKIGQDKISIKILESKIEKRIQDIGKYVLGQIEKKEKSVLLSDKKLVVLVKEIDDFKKQILNKQKDIDNIKNETKTSKTKKVNKVLKNKKVNKTSNKPKKTVKNKK